jgi:hypothetical protein
MKYILPCHHSECGLLFQTDNIDSHLREAHNVSRGAWHREACAVSFSSRSTPLTHVESHDIEYPPFFCVAEGCDFRY